MTLYCKQSYRGKVTYFAKNNAIYFIKQDNARDIRLQWRQSLDFFRWALCPTYRISVLK